MTASVQSPLLTPALLARLSTWELSARGAAEGSLAGRHRGKRRGRAMEFSGHRPYTPSDDSRRVDWRAYARTDRWLVREEEEESNRNAVILLDVSASMGYAGDGRPTKLRCAAALAAAFSYALLRQGEAVGGGLFSAAPGPFLPPRAGLGRLAPILSLWEGAAPLGDTRLDKALDDLGGRLRRRTWVLVFSDFWGGGDPFPALRRLLARGHEAAVVMPLDPWELTLPPDEESALKDLETGATLRVSPSELRARYQELSSARFSSVEAGLSSLRVPAFRCMTDRPLEDSLSGLLSRLR